MQIKTITGYHYTPTRVAKIKRLTIHSGDEDLEQPELPYNAGGNIKWYNHFGKHFGSLHNRLKIHFPYNSTISLLIF